MSYSSMMPMPHVRNLTDWRVHEALLRKEAVASAMKQAIDTFAKRANHFEDKATYASKRGWAGRERYYLRKAEYFMAKAVKMKLAGVL